jgi:hypothetical protein
MYVSTIKSSENDFELVSALPTKALKTFPHSKRLRGQPIARELQAEQATSRIITYNSPETFRK